MELSDAKKIPQKLGEFRAAVTDWVRVRWVHRWFRLLAYALAAALLLYALLWILFIRNLPDARALVEYESPLPTVVRDVEGEPFYSYARERRVQLEYADFPRPLIHAFLAAEDKTFFSHGGIDYPGIVSALINNLQSSGRSRGASTITQQVAKNLLLTNEYSYTRKLKEAILAKRIEANLSKEQILSLYLNEIALGRQSFGVEAAAQAYFGKSVDELQLHETAFLAILPKAPERYGRSAHQGAAITRRNWVLGEMRENGWITEAQMRMARAQPLGLAPLQGSSFKYVGGYFTEEVRRQLIDIFGETEKEGPNSVYAGGLWVRTSMNQKYQEEVTKALRDGLLRYHGGRAWKSPIATIPMDDGQWRSRLVSSNIATDYSNWRIAVALSRQGREASIGFSSGETATLTGAPDRLKAGDIIAVAPVAPGRYVIRTVPEVGGGMIVENPHNGRILAVQGGFDFRISSFNRATQAKRQPGSTIKPFVYATALDNGMTPASIIIDGPYCVWQSASLGQKCFRNFDNKGGAGPHTMRWGLEQSRNLMTVRAAAEAGMENVTETFRNVGIGDYQPFLSFALGAGDTTVEKMTNAYSILVNHGQEVKPSFVDFVQDRRGKVIWPENWRACRGCNMADWDGKPMPRFTPAGRQVMDPITAYQVVHMLEGVVQRGTAVRLRDMNRPMFGKTGTTSGPTNVWFVGGTPHMVAGVYLGYDQPRNLGGYAQGSSVAVPIFKQFALAVVQDMPKTPFLAPEGVRLVRIDRKTGKRVYGDWPDDGDPLGPVIWEAFKPETEPKRSIRQEELEERGDEEGDIGGAGDVPREVPAVETTGTQADRDFLSSEGGIY